MSGGLLAGYPAPTADEAVTAEGRLRPEYAALEPVVAGLGTEGIAGAARALAELRAARGVALGSWTDGRHERHPVVLDPLPRVLPADQWRSVAAGVEQRHRALGAFLADVYRAAGRRRGDVDRAPEIVRAGVLPEWAVEHNPARDPAAIGQAWRGQPRATVAAADLVRTADGGWAVTADDLRTPAGLGFALEDRLALRAALPGLFAAAAPAPLEAAVDLLRAALAEAAPPACAGVPEVAVLSAGEGDSSRFEHAVLAAALGVPVVTAGDLWPRPDGGLEVAVDGERRPVDVLYRRFDEGTLGAYRTPVGSPLDVQLTEAVRAGLLGLANVPGNGVADDAATFAWVPAMIGFYLGEQPLLPSPRTCGARRPGLAGRGPRPAGRARRRGGRRLRRPRGRGRSHVQRRRAGPPHRRGRRDAAPVRRAGAPGGGDRAGVRRRHVPPALGKAAGVLGRLRRRRPRPPRALDAGRLRRSGRREQGHLAAALTAVRPSGC
nr:circularly permuted type 2 ATP-grasp protein [Blastococcus sp. TML/C7B]